MSARAALLGSSPRTLLVACVCGHIQSFNKTLWRLLGMAVCRRHNCCAKICYKDFRVILSGRHHEQKGAFMPDRESDSLSRPTDRVCSFYTFERVEARDEGLAHADAWLLWLEARARAHAENDNAEGVRLTNNISQEVLHAVERLCAKWEEFDRRGLTY
jgi:hypothetical protein